MARLLPGVTQFRDWTEIAGLIERWRPQDERPEILHDRLRWQPTGAPEPLEFDVCAYVARFAD